MVSKNLFLDAIVALYVVRTSMDAKFSRGSSGIPGGKSVVLSPPSLHDFLTAQFIQLGISVVGHARNLGINFLLCCQRHSEVRAARRVSVEL